MISAAALLAIAWVGVQSNRDDMRPAKAVEANRTMQMFSDCVAGRSADTAKIDKLFRQPSDGPGLAAAGKALGLGQCMPESLLRTQMRMSPSLMRAALFDARYRRQFGKQAVDITNVAPLTVANEFDGAPSSVDVFTRRLGDCVVRKTPAASRDLALSRSGSDAENDALTVIRPALSGCMTADNTLRLSRPMVRGIVGEALYKLSLAAAPDAGRIAGTKN